MNTTSLPILLLALQGLTGICSAQQPTAGVRSSAAGQPIYRERISEEELVKLRTQSKPLAGGESTQAAVSDAPRTFADTSDFIGFNGFCTFVPKGAVLHLPDRLQKHKIPGLTGQVLFWTDFLSRFPAVVEPLEITLQEASGAKPIDPARLASAKRSERIVVTVNRGNPTTLAQPRVVAATTSR